METETDWQPTPEQDRDAAEWHELQQYLDWCEAHCLIPNEATEQAYADMRVELELAEGRGFGVTPHYGCVHSIGYCADPGWD